MRVTIFGPYMIYAAHGPVFGASTKADGLPMSARHWSQDLEMKPLALGFWAFGGSF